MFTTHPAFKHSIQLDAKSTTRRAVEIELQTPWFLATVFDSNEDIERTFILSGCDDVLLFAEQAPLGKLIGLTLVQSPAWSATQGWALLPIRRVDRVARPAGDIDRTAVVVDAEGVRHGGFPVSPGEVPPGLLIPVLDLPLDRAEGPQDAG